MGIFSIVVGCVLIAVFVFAGYAAACALVMPGFANVLSGGGLDLAAFFSLPTASNWYIFVIAIVVGIIFALQIGLGLVMDGINSRKLDRLTRMLVSVRRGLRRNSEQE